MRAPILALVLLFLPSVAQADVSRARAAFEEGIALSRKGDWEGAVARYQASLELKRAPITLYSLGVAQRELGRSVEALHSFRAFLAEPASAADGDITPFHAAAQDAIDEMAHEVARIALTVHPRAATVRIDGELCLMGREPCFVEPGRHRVVVAAPGYRDVEREVSVKPGETRAMTLHLEEEGLPLVPIGLVAGGALAFGGGLALSIVGMSQPGTDAGLAESVAGQVLLGSGLAVGAVGSVLWALAPRPEAGDVALLPGTTTSPLGFTLAF
ncbi:MAG: PEGA domain-containing protein [Myxococcales bacterium]|nr:PEGA domain-containing protein [Myxococcales bacterium]